MKEEKSTKIYKELSKYAHHRQYRPVDSEKEDEIERFSRCHWNIGAKSFDFKKLEGKSDPLQHA